MTKNQFIISFIVVFASSILAILRNNTLENYVSAQNIQDEEFEKAIDWMYENNLTKYKNQEDFLPKNTLNREQAASFLIGFVKNSLNKNISNNTKCEFKDLYKADKTLKEDIKQACKLGIMKGFEGKFFPKKKITRAEFFTVVIRAIVGDQREDINPWRKKYFDKAKQLGLTKENNALDQDRSISRYEAGLIFFRASQKDYDISSNKQKEDISISFENEMNKESVNSNLKLFPQIKYKTKWKDEKNMKLILSENFNKQTKLLVNIDKNAKQQNGDKLGKTISKSFKIDPTPSINFVSPQGEITDTNKNITVRFSSPMVNLTTLDNQRTCPIEITPSIEGKCVRITTSTFQFRPENNFPKGAEYSVHIPSGIKNVSGNDTTKSKNFKIKTPKFKVVNTPSELNKDQKISIIFNDKVDLEKFKNNFSINGYKNNELKMKYGEQETSIKGETKTQENIVQVFPKQGDRGYDKKYNYTIGKNLTSKRGNLNLGKDISKSFQTNKFVTDHNPFIYKSGENKDMLQNILKSKNKNIVTKKDPNIIFTFQKDIELDKSLFELNYPFELRYLKAKKDEDIKTQKNKLILDIKGYITNSLNVKIKASNVSSSKDISINFQTEQKNKITNFKNINYKKSCITTSKEIRNHQENLNKFNFDKYGEVKRINKVTKYQENEECSYQKGKNKYLMYTNLNPNDSYNLEVKKNLIDKNNYLLDKSYNFSFNTPKALNEDKHVDIIGQKGLVMIPEKIKPLTVGIKSTNINKVNVKVCEGKIKITQEEYIGNQSCNSKNIDIENLGFKPKISVLNLNSVFEGNLDKDMVKVEVDKIKKDKTNSELENDHSKSSRTYNISNISATIKGAQNSLLRLRDYNTGKNLTDKISNIKAYNIGYDYNKKTREKNRTIEESNNLNYNPKSNGLYDISINENYDIFKITLKSGKEVILDNIGYRSSYDKTKTYLFSDRPLYKPGDKVNIKGVSRILNPEGYDVNKNSINLKIRDSRRNEIINKNITLSQNGTFNESFKIPKDANLGEYSVSAGGENISFSVEEFETPDFKIEANSKKDSYLNTENAKINVSADYYLGLPLSNGEVEYNVTTTEFNFDGGKTNGYHFGEDDNMRYYEHDKNDLNENFKNGKTILNEQGEGNINFELNSGANNDKIYNVGITVEDPDTSQKISKNISFKGIRSKTFLGMKFDNYYYNYQDTANIEFVATDIKGNKLPNKKFNFNVYKINYSKDNSSHQRNKEEELIENKRLTTNSNGIATANFKFNDFGEYRFEIVTPNGKYKTTKNKFISGGGLLSPASKENEIQILSNKEKYNVGDNAEIVISSPRTNIQALITVEKLDKIMYSNIVNINKNKQPINLNIKKEYIPNFEVKAYLIKDVSADKNTLQELATLRAKMKDIEQKLQERYNNNIITPYIIEQDYTTIPRKPIPEEISEEDKELYKKLTEFRTKEQELLDKLLPTYYKGSKEISVDTKTVELNSNVQLNKESFKPGESQTITLNITNNNGNPINGEATIRIIDDALLALKQNKQNILDYFYSNNSNYVSTFGNMSNLINRLQFSQSIIGDSFGEEYEDTRGGINKTFGRGGLEAQSTDFASTQDAGNAASKAKSNNEEGSNKIRKNFKDLAFYKAKVDIQNGKAKIDVSQLPDNLTTRVIDGFVNTKNTEVGMFKNKFKVQKDIGILPQIPRFFVAGDELKLGALITNNTNSNKTTNVGLNISNAENNNPNQNIDIPANGSKLVKFPIKINDISKDQKSIKSDITITARSNNLSDTVKLNKDIKRPSTAEYTFTNGSTKNKSYEEKIFVPNELERNGYLEISMGATILTNLMHNINQYLSFPKENLLSRIRFLKITNQLERMYKNIDKLKEFKNIKVTDENGKEYNIKEVRNKIKEEISLYQQNDGGLAYFKDCYSESRYCSNFNVTKEYLMLDKNIEGIDNEQVTKYYKSELKNKIQRFENAKNEISNFLPLAIHKEYEFIRNNFELKTKLSNKEKIKYIRLYELMPEKGENTDKYYKELKNNILIEARGSLLPANDSYQNNITSTAMMLSLMLDIEDNEKLETENMARWILANRNDNGKYFENNIAEILKSLNKYIEKTGELDKIDFSSAAYLENKKIMESSFDKSNRFEVEKQKFDLKNYINFGEENSLGFIKEGIGKLYYEVGMRYFLPNDKIQPRDEGLILNRSYYDYQEYQDAFEKQCYYPIRGGKRRGYGGIPPVDYCKKVQTKNINPINSANKGDFIVGEVQLVVPFERNDIEVRDYIPSGAEILNTSFDTTSKQVEEATGQSGNGFGGFDHIEQKNENIYLYADHLNKGTYTYTYVMQASHEGEFNTRPARAELIERPEIWGRSSGKIFKINNSN